MKGKEESQKAGLKINIPKTKITASSPITSWQTDGETVRDFIFLGSKITADAMKLKAPWKKSCDKSKLCNKKHRYHFPDKGLYSQSYGFFSSHVWMWELDHKAGWALKNWCFWTVVLEKTFESSLDSKVIEPVHPKGNHTRIFIGKTDAVAEAPILWPPDVKSPFVEKDPDAGKDWGEGCGRGRDG